ncbi:MAG TPA: 2-dehydro-3-deoxy-D-gluconate 5-dehydrogenase KduD [Vicinamibacteria bacterium]|nr:2-dehydro-3-deoxy-D-gluconate 5-dehydrogenase KduD [Vicinamibacteria bacterium]
MKTFSLEGRTALVTGASRGIGAAMAVGLAEAGADVVVHGNSRSPDETCRAVQATGRRAFPITADLGDPAASRDLVDRAVAAAGRLDILVNNAGIIRRGPTQEFSDEDWLAVLEVDLNAVFRLSAAMGRHLLSGGRPGKIVSIASLLSFQGGINVAAYAAAKGGVAQLTKALANEWAGKRINVNAIAPGYIRTDNTAALQADTERYQQILGRIPAGRWGEPEDLKGAAVFLSSTASDFVNGHVLVVDGGWMGR